MEILSIVSLLVTGILEGSIYSLIAIGLSLIIGVMRIVNITHGDIMIFGALSIWWLVTLLGLEPFLGLIIVVPLTFAMGVFVQKFIVQPSIKRVEYQTIASLIVTYGLALIIMQSEFIFWSPDYRIITTSYTEINISVGGLTFSLMRFLGFVALIGLASLTYVIMSKTSFGMAIRACTQDRDAARVLGVNFEKTAYLTFGFSASLAAIAGLLYVLSHVLNPGYGLSFTIKGFVALIFGGMGSIIGPLICGLLVGIFESFGTFFVGGLWKDTITYIVLLIILLIKPTGILGKKEVR